VLDDYERVVSKLGVEHISELRPRGRGDADGDDAPVALRCHRAPAHNGY